MPDQIPLPCTSCGAPMREAHGDAGPFLSCERCGRRESIPAEYEARIRFLRDRLTNLSFAKARVDGVARVLVQGWSQATLGWLITALVIVAWVGFADVPHILDFWQNPPAELPAEEHQRILAEMVTGSVTSVFLVCALAMGYVLAFAYARSKIRPLLLARPPAQTGPGPLRCRCCGGPLAEPEDAFLDCHFCGAQNLMTESAATHVGAAAHRDAKEHGLRADQAARKLELASSPVIFIAIWVVSFVVFAGARHLALELLTTG